jgi:predicted CXXCH cytochrome family protein
MQASGNSAEPSRFVSLLVGAVVAGMFLLGYAYWMSPPPAKQAAARSVPIDPLPKPAERSLDFVGSQACAECHQEISERYQTHAMSRSLRTVAAVDADSDFEEVVPGQRGKRYVAVHQAGAATHHEQAVDDQGIIYDIAIPIQYVLGSGVRGRAYLSQGASGFNQSPIGWYASDQRWDLSPGYEHSGLGFKRRIGDGCLYCHVGRLNPDPDQFRARPFAEAAIGCERCHGPAGAHVKAMRGADPAHATELHLPSIAALPPERREAICTQCHLLGDAITLRYGRKFFDFRPGDALEDVFVIYSRDSDSGDEKRAAISQVEGMHQSVCFQKSEGRLSCVSCHDPHGAPTAQDRDTYYRARCLQCHSDRGCSAPAEERQAVTKSDSCLVCHMPRSEANDVPHTSTVDHRILRRPLVASSVPKSYGSAPPPEIEMAHQIHTLKAFQDADRALSEREANRARGLAYAQMLEATKTPLIALNAEPLLNPYGSGAASPEEVFHALGDDVESLLALALVYSVTERQAQAVAYWRRALELDPDNEIALSQLAFTLHDANEFVEARIYLERLLEIRPDLADVHGRLAHVLAQFEDWQHAIQAAERGLALDPSMVVLREWLVKIYQRRKELPLANKHLDILRRLKALQRDQGRK